MSVQLAQVPGRPGQSSHYLAPLALIVMLALVIAVVLTIPGHSAPRNSASAAHAARPHVPPYWIVRSGDTLLQISGATGLSIGQLEAFNPNMNPQALIPGERLNLWRHPPVPRHPPPGPMFWTVRVGQSFGSIADSTGINIDTLEALNPKLASGSLQPGEKVRLRR